MPKKPLISIVIPSFNSEKYIAKCLNSLKNQITKIPYEIIVVDSSKDHTPSIIKEQFPFVRLIQLKKQTLPEVITFPVSLYPSMPRLPRYGPSDYNPSQLLSALGL